MSEHELQDFVKQEGGKPLSRGDITRMKRKIFHSCLEKVLSTVTDEAYDQGVPLICGDGVKRRIFPRYDQLSI